jgi:hypothetical protein
MRVRTLLGSTAALLFLVACGKSKQQQQVEAAAAQLEQVGKQMGDAIASAGAGVGAAAGGLEGKASEAVDFRELKALLPEDLSGMKRGNAEGQKSSAMGFTLSTAEARYQAESGASIKITITDAGAMAGMAGMAMFAWAGMTIDKEDDNGYEKTTTLKGYRAYEKYNVPGKSGELNLVVGGRFIVQVEGNDASMDDMKSALDKMDLGKLEGMKGFGVK